MKSILILCLFFATINLVFTHENKIEVDEDEEDFVATKEWQVVKKGQRVPQGLHVRINFETGITEAKLIDEKDKGKSGAVIKLENGEAEEVVPDERIQNLNDNFKKSFEDALKHIKSDDPATSVNSEKFRDYEELKKELNDLNLIPTTDAEVMKGLIDRHKQAYEKSHVNDDEILVILEDLEYLVHQYDNALDFIKMDGFKEVVYKNLNSTNTRIKMDALRLLGASLQNHVKSQIYALENGGLDIILKILALDSDRGVKNRAIYSLGALLRRFPLAQQKFIVSGGLTVLSKLFEGKNMKLQTKAATLIYDLIVEQQEAATDKSVPNHEEKLKQYNQVSFKEKIVENNFCVHFRNLMVSLIHSDIKDYDSIEKSLKTIELVIDECLNEFKGKFTESLKLPLMDAQSMSQEELKDNEDYLHTVERVAVKIFKKLNSKYEKSEL